MRILTVMCRLLYPPDKGGKIRSSKLFERLKRDHHITVLSLRYPDETGAQVERMRACCHEIETVPWRETEKFTPPFFAELARNTLLSKRPYIVAKYHSPELERLTAELLATGAYDLLVCDFLQASANVVNLPFRPKVLFQHNVEAVIRKRQYKKEASPLRRAVLYNEWRKLFRYEKEACGRFDRNIMVSAQDCETMRRDYGLTNTSSIPTGVDVDYFQTSNPEPEGSDIVFTGSMDWLPNEDGIQWFVGEILPLIRQEVPDVRFWVVGRNPTAAVRKLGEDHADVQVTGTVDDIRPYIDRGSVFVVPLRIGGGTRIKIFEAMAMERAVVSTRMGAEGLPVSHDEDIVLADDPAAFASEVVRLLRDRVARRALGATAGRLVHGNFTHDVVAQRFGAICEEVLHRARGAS
jgi:glycosyltransferase involved in cell wall biosynthesis